MSVPAPARAAARGGPRRPFAYRGADLSCGRLRLATVARRFGTPCYVYDLDAILRAFGEYESAFAGREHLVCASVKANGNLSVLKALAGAGAGFDIVSGGELGRVLAAGGVAQRVVFSGVGKTAAEMDAALAADILLFNVESEPELALLAQRAQRARRRARFGLRVNPDVSAPTHPHIATGLRRHKFGVEPRQAAALYRRYGRQRWLEATAISFHIGSQILAVEPFAEAAARVARLACGLRAEGLPLRYLDFGGGLGIAYRGEQAAPPLAAYARALQAALGEGADWTLLLEPGRRIFAAAGTLLTRVLYLKENAGHRFVIVDAASNDLIRPALYGAYHEIVPLRRRGGRRRPADVVGPICESGDAFAHDRPLPLLAEGDLLAILDAGAYGFSLASNYNSRPRAAEVVIAGGRARLARRRECVEELLAAERDYVAAGRRGKEARRE
ncbi:MAG: diaminopimelate decarboxylase [Terriglobales bacterium]